LRMIVAVQDPETQCILAAYFAPYLWFPGDPKRPYRLRKDDRFFWGHRIYEYRHRIQFGRIALTITDSPILFFTSEEKILIGSIIYHILVRFGSSHFLSLYPWYLKQFYSSTYNYSAKRQLIVKPNLYLAALPTKVAFYPRASFWCPE